VRAHLITNYVVHGGKAIRAYDTLLLPEAERHKIAEELGVTEEKVKKALLSYVSSRGLSLVSLV